ncbi:hypothetical protein [Lysobacter sp. F60174L2]|uniref:hypothetical protein n=1 Tax=Lysobacter sp. F60174L2 TaxID=3459295 RepID=UPI00403DC94B
MNDNTQWWLATLGRTVIWARLRVLEAGTAEVFDSDGNTLPYDSEDSARAALMDAEFTAIDGMDEDDADARGFTLQELTPPRADDDAKLRALMVQKLPTRH